jgi:hypothetical protein
MRVGCPIIKNGLEGTFHRAKLVQKKGLPKGQTLKMTI